MNRQTAETIIKALQNSADVERIAIKDNSVDSKAYFTLEQYEDESNELTADYVCFYLKIADSDKANVKQTRFHFESSKKLVLNVQYREIVASNSAFNVKTSSIDYKCTADYESAIQSVLDVHRAYVKAQREKAQTAQQNSTAKRVTIKAEQTAHKATVKRKAQKAQ